MSQRGGGGSGGHGSDGRGSGGRGSGDDGYDWLYGGQEGPDRDRDRGGDRGGGRDEDAEHTQVLPSGSPARSSGRRADAPPSSIAREPGRERSAPARPARQRRRRPALSVLKWLLLAWLVFLLAVPVWAFVGVTKVDAEPDGQRPDDEGGTNYLIVGSDARGGLAGARTDTIMLLHTGKGPNVLMSIPRDSIVEIPGRGTNKINAAFAYGGPKLLVSTFEQNTGIRVDDYVEIGFQGLVKLVDAVGGITICPNQDMKDADAKLDIKQGCQEADGKTALGYARSRKLFATGDIQRAQNQREVVSAIGSEVLSWQTFVNPVRYYRVVTGGAESVKLGENTGPLAVAKFGIAMNRVDGESGRTCAVPIADFAVNWDAERAPELFGYLQRNEADQLPDRLCTPTGQPG